MKIDIYQVGAFAEKVFEGNPAAVCPLEEWVSDDVLRCYIELQEFLGILASDIFRPSSNYP